MKVTINIPDYKIDSIRRMIENLDRIGQAINSSHRINRDNSWMLDLQNHGIYTITDKFESDLKSFNQSIIDELREIGASAFIGIIYEKEFQEALKKGIEK